MDTAVPGVRGSPVVGDDALAPTLTLAPVSSLSLESLSSETLIESRAEGARLADRRAGTRRRSRVEAAGATTASSDEDDRDAELRPLDADRFCVAGVARWNDTFERSSAESDEAEAADEDDARGGVGVALGGTRRRVLAGGGGGISRCDG